MLFFEVYRRVVELESLLLNKRFGEFKNTFECRVTYDCSTCPLSRNYYNLTHVCIRQTYTNMRHTRLLNRVAKYNPEEFL